MSQTLDLKYPRCFLPRKNNPNKSQTTYPPANISTLERDAKTVPLSHLIYYYPCVNLVIVERSGEIEKIIIDNLFCVFVQLLYPECTC